MRIAVSFLVVAIVGGSAEARQPPQWIATWGSYGTSPGQLINPTGVAVDNQDFVYFVDQANHRAQKFTTAGAFVSEWGGYGTAPGVGGITLLGLSALGALVYGIMWILAVIGLGSWHPN